MKVLLISEYFPPKIFGGGEISASLLAKALAKEGADVSVLTSYFSGLKDFETDEGVKIYRRLLTGKNPKSLCENLKRKFLFPISEKNELAKLDRAKNFDVIHCLNMTSIAGCKTSKRTIATINSYSNFCPKGNLFYMEKKICNGCNFLKYPPCIINSEYAGKLKLNFYLRYNPVYWFFSYLSYKQRENALKKMDTFIVVSDFIKDLLLKKGIKKERIKKIPNLVSIGDSKEEYKLEKKNGEIFVTYIGNLEKIKGVSLLVEAFNEIKNAKAKLLIIGDGPERKNLEKISGKRARFLGNVNYKFMPAIYKKSDIIVLPSLWPEPLSRVLLEALYFGKPIIATNAGGNSECVAEGKNGFLTDADKAKLKEKLSVLINDAPLRKQMAKESIRISKEKFGLERIVAGMLKNYENP